MNTKGLVTLIDHELKARGWSQNQLAERSGINANTLSAWRRDETQIPTLHNFARLSNTLNIPIRELIEACDVRIDEKPSATAEQQRIQSLLRIMPELRFYLDDLAVLTPNDREAILTMLTALANRRRQEQEATHQGKK